MLPEVPITRANVLVAFATIGSVRKKSSVGKVIRVPPPATALTAPPMAAANMSPMTSLMDILHEPSLRHAHRSLAGADLGFARASSGVGRTTSLAISL